MEQDFGVFFVADDCNAAFAELDKLIYDAYNASCPIKTKTVSMKKMRKPWITNEILSQIRLRNAYSELWKINRLPTDYYRRHRNYVTNIIRIAKRQYYLTKFESVKSDIKKTWRVINSILKPSWSNRSNTPIKTIICDDVIYTDPHAIAERMNEYFAGVGSELTSSVQSLGINPMTYLRGTYQGSFFYSYVDVVDVKNIVMSLRNKPCNILVVPVVVLKAIADIISPPLAYRINMSFLSGNFPTCLKIARITSIFKSEDPTEMSNYRPISILSNFSKIYEKLIYIQLYKYIERYNILYKHQYGFRNRKCTTNAILNHLKNIYNNLERNQTVISIYLDFKKAFDCVDHRILLQKLHSEGSK